MGVSVANSGAGGPPPHLLSQQTTITDGFSEPFENLSNNRSLLSLHSAAMMHR